MYPSGTGTMPFYPSGTGISQSIFPSSGLGPIVPSLTSSVPYIAPSQICVVLRPSLTFILQVSGSDTANGMFLQVDPSDDTQFALFTDNRDDATNFEIKYATQLTVTSPQFQREITAIQVDASDHTDLLFIVGSQRMFPVASICAIGELYSARLISMQYSTPVLDRHPCTSQLDYQT